MQDAFSIREIRNADNAVVAELIRGVLTEHGAVGEGYSIVDPEIGQMYEAYQGSKSVYLVVVQGDKILGSAGIAPLDGGAEGICELRKMFFLPELRGRGMGYELLRRLMIEAKKRGYQSCYLETLERMKRAVSLYEKFGFRRLDAPEGETGHCACDRWYKFDLDSDF